MQWITIRPSWFPVAQTCFQPFWAMHRLCKKQFLTALTHQDVTHRLGMNAEGDSYFDAGKIESKLTPKCAKELVGKDVVCKGRHVGLWHELNSTVVQDCLAVLVWLETWTWGTFNSRGFRWQSSEWWIDDGECAERKSFLLWNECFRAFGINETKKNYLGILTFSKFQFFF